jgi:hypothetical protein
MAKIFQNWSHSRLDSQHIPKSKPKYSKIEAVIDIANIFQNWSQNRHGQNIPKSEPKIFGHNGNLNKGCVTLWPLPFTLKSILRPKRRIMKTQKYNLQKIL